MLEIIERQTWEESLHEVPPSSTLSGTESPEAKMGSRSEDNLMDPSTSSEPSTDGSEVASEDPLKEGLGEKCPFESFISSLEEFAYKYIETL